MSDTILKILFPICLSTCLKLGMYGIKALI